MSAKMAANGIRTHARSPAPIKDVIWIKVAAIFKLFISVATRKHIMVDQKYFKGRRQTSVWGGQKYTKYNKINNNSENFRGARLLPEGFAPCPPYLRACHLCTF